MNRANGIAPPAASIAARTSSAAVRPSRQPPSAPVRSPRSAKRITRPGSTPSTSVPAAVIASAAVIGGGVTIGVRSPSGDLVHPHLAHHPEVVGGGDRRVDGADHGQHVRRRGAGVEHGLEGVELGDPAAERRDAGERGEEHRHQHGQPRGVRDQPAERRDLAAVRLAGDGDDDGEGAEVREAVDEQVHDDGLQRRLRRLPLPTNASGIRMNPPWLTLE